MMGSSGAAYEGGFLRIIADPFGGAMALFVVGFFFARVFRRVFGVTPAKFVERARVARARVLLEEEDQTLDQIASHAGFGSAERMRRSFARQLHVVPDQYRRNFEAAGERTRQPQSGGSGR